MARHPYDRQGHEDSSPVSTKTRADDDELRQITGINPDEEQAMEDRATTDDMAEREGLKNLDKEDSKGSKGKSDESGSGEEGGWKTDLGGNRGGSRFQFLSNRRAKKTGIGLGITGLLVGGGMGIFSVLSPFAAIANMDFALDKPNRGLTSSVQERLRRGFLRYVSRPWSEGEWGETRVGRRGSKFVADFKTRMQDSHGISFGSDRNGQMTSMTVDLGEGPFDIEAQRTRLANEMGLPRESITADGGNRLRVDTPDISTTRTALSYASDLDISTRNTVRPKGLLAMRYRLLNKFYDAPSWWRPIERLKAANKKLLANSRLNVGRKIRNAMKNYEVNHPDKLPSRVAAKYRSSLDSIRSKVSPGALKTAGASLALLGGVCTIRDIAGLIPAVNRALAVVPAMAEVSDIKGTASTVKAMAIGDSIEEVGAVASRFSSDAYPSAGQPAKSISGAASMHSLIYGGAGQGAVADRKTVTAFTSRGGTVEALVNSLNDDPGVIADAGSVADGGFFDAACSRWGMVVQTGLGLALNVVAPGSGTLASQGLSAVRSAMTGALMTMVATHIAVSYIEDRVENLCGVEIDHEEQTEVVKDAHKLGDCLAYGAVAAADTVGPSMGGAEVSSQQYTALADIAEQEEVNEFRNLSTVARLFDITNARSLMSKMLLPLSLNAGGTATLLSGAGSGILSLPGKLLAGLGSVLSGTTYAQETTYDFGAPRIAVPLDLIDKYPDALENARIVEGYNLQDDTGSDTQKKIETCFGGKIQRVGTSIQFVSNGEEVNVAEKKYQEEGCDDVNERWERIRLFILDDSIVTSIACRGYGTQASDDTACADLGFSATDNSSTSTGSSFPCRGQNRPVPKGSGDFVLWDGITPSATAGNHSDGSPINVYIREACTPTNAKTLVILGSIHGSENGGQMVGWDMLFNASLPDNVRVIVIPELCACAGTGNRGSDLSVSSTGMQVDLNRNFDYRWNNVPRTHTIRSSGRTYSKGDSPESTAEARGLALYLRSLGKIDLFVSYHDALGYTAAAGNRTPVSLAQTYAQHTPDAPLRSAEGGRVRQGGSVDGWVDETLGFNSLLVEMTNNQSQSIIDGHVAGLTAAINAAQ